MSETKGWARFFDKTEHWRTLVGTISDDLLEYPTEKAIDKAEDVIIKALDDHFAEVPDALLAIGSGAIAFISFVPGGGTYNLVIGPHGELEIQRLNSREEKRALCN